MHPGIYQSVIDWIPDRARVLDLGTGDGTFLEQLVQKRHVVAEAVEKDPELVARCIKRGLVAHQSNIADGLDQYGDQTFDYVLLLGTFQELLSLTDVVRDAFRVGRRVVVAYSNFAYYHARLQLLFEGRTPVTKSLPQPWYRTSNLHFLSIRDFREFCRNVGILEIRQAWFNPRGKVVLLPNFFAEEAVSLLSRPAKAPFAP